MKRLLFVDDDPAVLEALRTTLADATLEWDAAFVVSAEDALKTLAQSPFDAVLTDIHLVGMGGSQLLSEVKARYPHMIRIAFSGCAHPDTILRTLQVAHQFVPKPMTLETVRTVVRQCCDLQDRLASAALQQLVGAIRALPSMPSLYQELVATMQSPRASIDAVATIIGKDMAMLSKVLQVVNSAYFGLRRTISSPSHAVSLLGLDRVKALTLALKVFEQFDGRAGLPVSLETLWRHGFATGTLAREIARSERAPSLTVESSFMAGLLHDVGQLVLAANFPEPYGEVLQRTHEPAACLLQAEEAAFGATHEQVGAYLLSLWGLSPSIVEAVAFHHTPQGRHREGLSALAAVHVANAIEEDADAIRTAAGSPFVDLDYLTACHLHHRLAPWMDLYRSGIASPSTP